MNVITLWRHELQSSTRLGLACALYGRMRTPTRPLFRRRASGFTLLEIVVVLLVIAMMATVATPPVLRAIMRSQVTNAASVMAGDFEQAFSLAARQRRPVRIVIDPSAKAYTITDRNGVVLRSRNFADGSDLEVNSMSPSTTTLDVFPTGLASGPLRVDLMSGSHSASVVMTRAGKVRISS